MALYLVQHGKSLPKDKDPDQGLSEEGIAEVKRIASVAGDYGIHVALIAHSVKKRARQTAEIFAAVLRPEKGLEERTGLKPMDDVLRAAQQLPEEDDVMWCGHLPFMEKLTSHLVAGMVEKPIFRFQNGGIVCLENDPASGGWHIKWTLMPHID